MAYTMTYTQPLKKKPFVYNVSLNTKKFKLQDHDPKEDEWPRDDRPYEGPVETTYPEPQESHIGIGPREIHDFGSKKSSKIKYNLKDDDDDDYIEVPGGSDTVPYTDDEGNQYEIPLDDLIEYDGDDGEIQYTSGKSMIRQKKRMNVPKAKRKFNQMQLQLAMIKSQMVRPRVYS